MAKYERRFHGDFDAALAKIHDAVINGSYSASYEDGSDYVSGDFRCAVRVYERHLRQLPCHGDLVYYLAFRGMGHRPRSFELGLCDLLHPSLLRREAHEH